MKSGKKNQADVRRVTALILKVRGGQITAKEAAQELGVSRKTYYEWEKKGLQAMMAALQPKAAGRPAKVKDPQQETLEKEVTTLKKELNLAQAKIKIQQFFLGLTDHEGKKKNGKV